MADNPTGSRGLFLLFTGNGKGKTTAALGLAMRALGHGQRVAMIQFIKGSWKYGELEAAKCFEGLLDFHVMGRGFTWKSDDLNKDIALAREAWAFACQILAAGRHQLVILDELTYLITYDMLDEDEVVRTLAARPGSMHVVVTGRGATDGLIEAADLVTEMREIKHPYHQGVRAQEGIEF
ncbi:cob(I)yrinic acid a,c-diamide adenosyltransferase [Desulfolithobacter sp.]